jgi:hypothetical protein
MSILAWTLFPSTPLFRSTLRIEEDFATLVSLGEDESVIAGLRRRRILIDSPRMVVRDQREASAPV